MPAAVGDLHITNAISATGQITATLSWTPPGTTLTMSVRYSDTLITDANWSAATVLSDSLPISITS